MQTWLEATKAGDAALVLALIAENAVFLQAGQPAMIGRRLLPRCQGRSSRSGLRRSKPSLTSAFTAQWRTAGLSFHWLSLASSLER